MSDSDTAVGILPHTHENFAPAEHGRGNAVIARFGPHGVLGIHIEFPDFFSGAGVEAVKPAVASGEKHLLHPIHQAESGGGPLAVQDIVIRRIVLPHDLAGILVDGDKAGRFRCRDLLAGALAAVGGLDEDQILPDDRR